MLLCAWLSDRLKRRYIFTMLGTTIASIGLAMLLNEARLGRDAKYAAVFLIQLGAHISLPVSLAWLAKNLSGRWKRAFGSAIQVMLGNIAGIVASNIFLNSEAPRYQIGYGTSFGMLWLGAVAATVMWAWMRRENGRRDAGVRDDLLRNPQAANMGDHHPSFRYTM